MSCLQRGVLTVVSKAQQLARLFAYIRVRTKLNNRGPADQGCGRTPPSVAKARQLAEIILLATVESHSATKTNQKRRWLKPYLNAIVPSCSCLAVAFDYQRTRNVRLEVTFN